MQSTPPDDGREWLTVSRVIDGEPVFSAFGLSILTGWDAADVVSGHQVPAAALRDGRRRISESAAATGSRDLDDALPFLAAQMGYDIINPEPFVFLAAKKVPA